MAGPFLFGCWAALYAKKPCKLDKLIWTELSCLVRYEADCECCSQQCADRLITGIAKCQKLASGGYHVECK